MASEKPGPGPGLEPQPVPVPVGLLAVGAGGGGGGASGASGGGGGMGELRGASGSGSVVLPAGMINPSVPIRNIRMKFAVLIGLIQVGEVSNRDIVETVLNLVSEKGCTCSASPAPISLSPLLTRGARPGSTAHWAGVAQRVTCPRLPKPRDTSLVSSGPLLPPERSAQLNTASYHFS